MPKLARRGLVALAAVLVAVGLASPAGPGTLAAVNCPPPSVSDPGSGCC